MFYNHEMLSDNVDLLDHWIKVKQHLSLSKLKYMYIN